jgi:hypothetical protein
MQRRWLYVIVFSLPALVASIIASFVVFGAAAGFLWLFVFGDNSWPTAASTTLVALFAVTCIVFCAGLLAVAYAAGRSKEGRASGNGKAVAISAGATALLAALAVFHQWSVGNLGAPSAETSCADFCRAKGFLGSGMPPRNSGQRSCSCLDTQGREAVKLPLSELPGQRK